MLVSIPAKWLWNRMEWTGPSFNASPGWCQLSTVVVLCSGTSLPFPLYPLNLLALHSPWSLPKASKRMRASAFVCRPLAWREGHFSVWAVCQGNVMFLHLLSIHLFVFLEKQIAPILLAFSFEPLVLRLFHQRVYLSGNISSKIEYNKHQTSSRSDAIRMFC